MNKQQINWFTTYDAGLIDSLLIAAEAKDYVTHETNATIEEDLGIRHGWKWANETLTAPNEKDPSKSDTLKKVIRNHKLETKMSNVRNSNSYNNANIRGYANKYENITKFLDEWLTEYTESRDQNAVFNVTNKVVNDDYISLDEYDNPFNDSKKLTNAGSVTHALTCMKWIGALQRITQKPVTITKEDLKEVGIETYDANMLYNLLKTRLPKSFSYIKYDADTKSATFNLAGRELQVPGNGPGFIKLDLGPQPMKVVEKMVDHALKVKEQLTKEILNNAI